VLLAGALVSLLLLNTASAQDSFRLHSLQAEDAALQQQQQALTSIADGLDDPSVLAKRAAELGLVAGDPPSFLPRGVAIPKGAIRVGNLIYAPGIIPVTPPPVVVTTPAAKASVKPAVKKPVVKKPVAKKPVVAPKVPVVKKPVVPVVPKAPVATATKPAAVAGTTTTTTPHMTATTPAKVGTAGTAGKTVTTPVAGGH
jgi:outer membrane biosynthesis protein TonB